MSTSVHGLDVLNFGHKCSCKHVMIICDHVIVCQSCDILFLPVSSGTAKETRSGVANTDTSGSTSKGGRVQSGRGQDARGRSQSGRRPTDKSKGSKYVGRAC